MLIFFGKPFIKLGKIDLADDYFEMESSKANK